MYKDDTTPIYCDRCGQANRPQARFCFNCGQALPERPPSAIPGVERETAPNLSANTGKLPLNHLLRQRYRIVALLGKGGMGAVYRAQDTQFGDRAVAIKEMSQSGLSPDEIAEATAAFKQEALLLANLMHPNLPRIYDHFSEEGQWYLVMDFIEGESLEQYLLRWQREHPNGPPGLPIAEVLDIGIQLSSVLGYLHSRQPPIIFRDLKPSNVMRTAEGHLYLIDFGIARHFKPGQVRDTRAFASWGYAAPEQYGKAQTTPRSDVYSLGATLHHLLTGQNPTQSPFRFTAMHSYTQPLEYELEKLIMLMVSLDEQQRPASMMAIKQELQRIAALQTSSQLVNQSQTLPSLTTATPEVSAASSVMPAGADASVTPPAEESASTPSPGASSITPRLEMSSSTPMPGRRLYTYSGHSERVFALAWSPDGRRVVSGGYDHTLQVWDATTGREIFAYRGHQEPVRTAAWSPDGTYIASGSNDHSAHVWEAASGRRVTTFRGHQDSVISLSWSPDGRLIVSASLSKQAIVWEALTGKRVATLRGHTSLVSAVAWSPDGTRIASASLDKTVRIYDISSWEAIFVYQGHSDSVTTLVWSPDSTRIASAGEDKTVQVWDATNGHHILTYTNHSDEVTALAWSPDGSRIASASEDKTVQVWDASSGDHLLTYSEHPEDVNVVAWSPDSTRLASAGDDGQIHVWQVT
ncbi:WD40 repeat domain-containing serine/threonine-protein kinase [Thermogemmatispora sp.]|uniref:WD40 repeat domain-containing serine/threonine-protein kinase n=1 Tax=Thermogemmatispora sp. TaxID=1968838 RepID=UPI002ACBE134|nr:WD40 repeat domain-containing serine/threonine-protein kinase [Thermogemmatispora sp.]